MRHHRPSRTAEIVCWMRALETRRPPSRRIIDDPFAHLFLSAPLRAMLEAASALSGHRSRVRAAAAGSFAYVPARHRFIDDALEAALRKSGPERLQQIVILGAGYDTRAYRFAALLDGRAVFEADFPATSARKSEIAAANANALPPAPIVRVPVDFLRESIDLPLMRAGLVPGARTFFVWEGVAMYLTREAVEDTLHLVCALGGPGSELCLDLWHPARPGSVRARIERLTRHSLRVLGEPFLFGLQPQQAGAFLHDNGLTLVDRADAVALTRRFVPDERRIDAAFSMARAVVQRGGTSTRS